MAEKLLGSAIQSGTITTTQLSGALSSTISQGGGPKILSLTYPGDDTAANSVGGQTVVVNGTGFQTNVQIYVNGNAVPSVTYTNANSVSFTTPSLNAATYLLYLTNTDDGGTAILIPGLQISGEPTWSTSATLPEQEADDTWSISLSATSDSNVSYTLAGGSSLPSGISLAANGLISGTLSSPPASGTTYNFTVVATDEENQDASRAFSVNVTVGEGVAFANTVLLLHGDGSNNQNNHTFLDSSNNNFTITRNGNATQGSFSPFSQTGWSGYFDGSGDYVDIASNNAFAYGTGDFTWEFWFRCDVEPVSLTAVYLMDHGSGNGGALQFFTSNVLRYYTPTTGTGSALYTDGPTIAAQRWYHVAAVRSSGTTTIYLDGVSTVSATDTTNFAAQSVRLGLGGNGTYPFKGHISNFRILKGTALYTSNFTPPTAPLTNIANTSLLTLQSNRFVDNSNNSFTVTPSGDAKIVPYSPLAPTSAYSTANVGGSVYLDGTGDYLSVADNAALEMGSSNFTIECWFYPLSLPADALIADFGSQGAQGSLIPFYCSSSSVVYYISSGGGTWNIASGVSFGGTLRIGQWHHLALVRNGNTYTPYFNGVAGTTTTNASAINDAAVNKFIGSATTGTAAINGYLSNFRVVKGTAVYTEAFTPPTAPLTNIANTSLLCNFTNAGIFDSTAKNVLETVGDAKISTSVVKYGTGSIAFDGTGDYVLVKPSSLLEFGSGDFTIELWWYTTSTSRQALYHGSFGTDWSVGIDYSSTSTNQKIGIWASSNGSSWNLINADPGGNGIGTTTITQNAWNHIAYVRSGTTWMLFVNGNRDLNLTGISGSIVNRATSQKSIGAWFSTGSVSQTTGYIDDLRISRFARYTSNFTPSTAAFKDR